MLASYDWRARHAGLIAIASIAEGTGKVMVNELGKIVECVLTVSSIIYLLNFITGSSLPCSAILIPAFAMLLANACKVLLSYPPFASNRYRGQLCTDLEVTFPFSFPHFISHPFAGSDAGTVSPTIVLCLNTHS